MYRIQAFNFKKQYFSIRICETMSERDAIIRELLGTGEYTRGGITFEHGRFFSC